NKKSRTNTVNGCDHCGLNKSSRVRGSNRNCNISWGYIAICVKLKNSSGVNTVIKSESITIFNTHTDSRSNSCKSSSSLDTSHKRNGHITKNIIRVSVELKSGRRIYTIIKSEGVAVLDCSAWNCRNGG